ncbi:MAG: hypothetical protein JSS30_06290 [Verrucomicrobia bacterium]|nr:hypothetical protein [Verrucomicrobiota bacterium]
MTTSVTPCAESATTTEQLPYPRTEELKRFLIALTKEGFSGELLPQNFSSKELVTAYALGKADLPKGDDALLAFYFNAFPLFELVHEPIPVTRTLFPKTALGQFFCANNFTLILSVLPLVCYLESSLGKQCSKISEHQIVLKWDHSPPLYLLVPTYFEQALECISTNLKIDDRATLSCLAQALAILLPSIPDVTPQHPKRAAEPKLREIYEGFCKFEDLTTATRFLYLLKCSGWDITEIVSGAEIPDLIHNSEMRKVFEGTSFARLFEKTSREEVYQELLASNDLSVLSQVWGDEKILKGYDFLQKIAPTINQEALPFALCAVCKLCTPKTSPLSPTERVQLLAAYLLRLKKQNPPFSFALSYEPKLRELIKGHRRYLGSAPELASFLMKESQDSKNWTELSLLLTALEKDDALLEKVVGTLEAVCSLPNAACCMTTTLTRPGQRLSKEQKGRLAKAYATFAAIGGDATVLQAPLDSSWVLGQLKQEETWREFTRFCVLARSTQEDHLQWIAHRALASEDEAPFRDLEVLLERVPSKPLLIQALVRNPSNVKLLNKLIGLVSGQEKECLEKCKALGAQERKRHLETYQTTGSIAELLPRVPTLEEQIEEAIEKKEHGRALILLKKAPPPAWALWDRFILSSPPKAILEESWNGWLAKHPIGEFKPEVETYWLNAIKHLLAKLDGTDASFYPFFMNHAIDYAEKLGREASAQLVGTCLETAIPLVWNCKTQHVTEVLRQIRAIDTNPLLIEKMGVPSSLLHFDFLTLLNLLLAKQPENELSEVGIGWCLDQMAQAQFGDMTNLPRLLKFYSQHAFVPRKPEVQDIFLDCIDLCQPKELYQQLGWMEKSHLMTTLCSYQSPSAKGSDADNKRISQLWEQLLFSFKTQKKEHLLNYCELFFLNTKLLLKRNLENGYLDHIWNLVLQDCIYHLPKNQQSAAMLRMKMYICSVILAQTPLQPPLVVRALTDLCTVAPFLNADSAAHIADFRNRLPLILSLDHPNIPGLVEKAVNSLLGLSWVQRATPGECHSWSSLITGLSFSLSECEAQRPQIAKVLCNVFLHCVHPTANTFSPVLVNLSLGLMTDFLISMPYQECLKEAEWNNLIMTLRENEVEKMCTRLLTIDPTKGSGQIYLNLLGLGRLLRHTTVLRGKKALDFCAKGLKQCLELLPKIQDPFQAIELPLCWLKALCFQKIATDNTPLVSQLTRSCCQLITDLESYKFFSKYIIEALSLAPEQTITIRDVLASFDNPILNSLKEFVLKRAEPKTPPK